MKFSLSPCMLRVSSIIVITFLKESNLWRSFCSYFYEFVSNNVNKQIIRHYAFIPVKFLEILPKLGRFHLPLSYLTCSHVSINWCYSPCDDRRFGVEMCIFCAIKTHYNTLLQVT